MNQPNQMQSYQTENQSASSLVHRQELELAAISLISQLELQIQRAFERGSHVESASENADKLLTVLLDFSDAHLSDGAAALTLKEIEKASFSSLAHREMLNSLSWGFAISNLFGKSASSDERVRQTYNGLGEALLCACVSTLRQTVQEVGTDSPQAQTIEQSIAVFVEEFRANW